MLACESCGAVLDEGHAQLFVGNLCIDRLGLRVVWRGRTVELSRQPIEILALLVQRAGRMVPFATFFIAVLSEERSTNQLQVQVNRARRAFRAIDPSFDQIETVWGIGYRWRAEEMAQ